MKKIHWRPVIGMIIIAAIIITVFVVSFMRPQKLIESVTEYIKTEHFSEAILECNNIEKDYPNLAGQAGLLRKSANLAWGKKNLAEKDYSLAKNHLIAATDGPDSPDEQEARTKLDDLTIVWVQHLIESSRFEEATKVVDDLSGSEVIKESDKSVEFLKCKNPEIFIDWGDSLASEKNYSEAIDIYSKGEKYESDCSELSKQLASKKTEASISNDIARVEALNAEGKYEDSIDLLRKSDNITDDAIRNVLAKSINGFVKTQIDDKKYTEALDYLTSVKKNDSDIYPELDMSVEKVNAFVLDDLISNSKLLEAYKMVNELLSSIGDETEKTSLSEKKDQILKQLSNDTGEDGKEVMKSLAEIACTGKPTKENEFSSLILVKGEKRKAYMCDYAFSLDSQFAASKPAELKYAIWGKESKKSLSSCSYGDGYSLTPEVVSWDIKIYDVLTGKLFTTTSLSGKYPTCPHFHTFYKGVFNESLTGDSPTIDQLNNYLKSVIR